MRNHINEVTMKTLALVGAHHDDIELNAGAIARHVKAGWKVVSIAVRNTSR